jgi:hypothetical protein
MAQYDIPLTRPGFGALSEAMAHRQVVGKLIARKELAAQVAQDWSEADKDKVESSGGELYKDLAPGKGHVIMLSQPEGRPLMGAELTYDVKTHATKTLNIDMGEAKLSQVGETYKLEEDGATTFFRVDDLRGVLTVMDADSEVPRIFGKADPAKLTAGTLQLGQPILIF